MKRVKYNDSILEYKSSHRSLVEYEKMTGKNTVDTYTDSITLMFCIVKSQAKIGGVKFDLDLDGFIDWLDVNPGALVGFTVEDKPQPEPEGTDQQKKS